MSQHQPLAVRPIGLLMEERLYYTSLRYIFGISFPVRYTCLSSAVFFSDDHT